MLPYRDHNRSRNFPVMTVAFIVLNTIIWLYEFMLSLNGTLDPFLYQWAVIPYNLTHFPGPLTFMTVLSAMFMHGSWMHFLGNMLYLWIFGDNVEDQLGIPLYVIFYFTAGIAATVAQVAVAPNSTIPNIGASGAIAGVLGAYLLCFPKARVDTLVLLGRLVRRVSLPAMYVLGFWIVLQFLSGFGSLAAATTDQGGVAYFAHIGGFLAGLGMMGLHKLWQ